MTSEHADVERLLLLSTLHSLHGMETSNGCCPLLPTTNLYSICMIFAISLNERAARLHLHPTCMQYVRYSDEGFEDELEFPSSLVSITTGQCTSKLYIFQFHDYNLPTLTHLRERFGER